MKLVDLKCSALVAVAAREVEENNIEVTLWKKLCTTWKAMGLYKRRRQQREGRNWTKGENNCFFRLWYIRDPFPYLKKKNHIKANAHLGFVVMVII